MTGARTRARELPAPQEISLFRDTVFSPSTVFHASTRLGNAWAAHFWKCLHFSPLSIYADLLPVAVEVSKFQAGSDGAEGEECIKADSTRA